MTKLHAGRQVRRRLLRRVRRSARGRRLRGERPVRPPGRRGRPRWAHPRHQFPPRRAGRVRGSGPGRHVRRRERAAQGQEDPQEPHAAPACGTGRTGRSSSRTPSSPWSTLHQRARQTAFLVPGLTIVVRDEFGLGDGGSKREESFRFDGGISEFCEYLAPATGRSATPSGCSGQRQLQGDRPGAGRAKGHMTPTEVTRELGVDVALRWGTGYDTTIRSFVNIIATPKGGTHVGRLRAARWPRR